MAKNSTGEELQKFTEYIRSDSNEDAKRALTPHSGLIQIRKYAENGGIADLLEKFDEISALTKKVKEEIHRLLVGEFKYFD
jgi:hypothetical protein